MKKQKGFLIIEVLLAIVILSMIFLTLFTVLSFTTNRTERSKFDSQASTVMQQGMELTRTTLLANWSSIGNGNYYPLFDANSSQWGLHPGTESLLQGRFTRVILVSSVCRESSEGALVVCPVGTLDLKSKLVSVKISWKEGAADKEIQSSLLVFNSKI